MAGAGTREKVKLLPASAQGSWTAGASAVPPGVASWSPTVSKPAARQPWPPKEKSTVTLPVAPGAARRGQVDQELARGEAVGGEAGGGLVEAGPAVGDGVQGDRVFARAVALQDHAAEVSAGARLLRVDRKAGIRGVAQSQAHRGGAGGSAQPRPAKVHEMSSADGPPPVKARVTGVGCAPIAGGVPTPVTCARKAARGAEGGQRIGHRGLAERGDGLGRPFISVRVAAGEQGDLPAADLHLDPGRARRLARVAHPEGPAEGKGRARRCRRCCSRRPLPSWPRP